MTLTKPSKKRMRVCAALFAVACSAPVYADTDSPKFTMMVISDTSAGKDILDGSYQAAIHKISTKKGKKHNEFATQTNSCVAHIKAKQLAKASTACDEALAIAESRLNVLGSGSGARESRLRQAQFDMTVALSNQGVLLAVRGEPELAVDAFESALEFKSPRKAQRKVVHANIARVNSSISAGGEPRS